MIPTGLEKIILNGHAKFYNIPCALSAGRIPIGKDQSAVIINISWFGHMDIGDLDVGETGDAIEHGVMDKTLHNLRLADQENQYDYAFRADYQAMSTGDGEFVPNVGGMIQVDSYLTFKKDIYYNVMHYPPSDASNIVIDTTNSLATNKEPDISHGHGATGLPVVNSLEYQVGQTRYQPFGTFRNDQIDQTFEEWNVKQFTLPTNSETQGTPPSNEQEWFTRTFPVFNIGIVIINKQAGIEFR